jgi:DNA-binding XRE family transcriptional regulator
MDTNTQQELPFIPTKLYEDESTKNRTDLILRLPLMLLTISLRSSLPPRIRRAYARTIFDLLRPQLTGIHEATILHRPCSPHAYMRDTHRNLAFLQKRSAPFQPEHEHLGLRMRTKRLSLGMRQKDLAHHTRISRTEISRIETGRHNPTALTLYRINEVLGRF